jgi:hypothetical protein
MEAFRGVARRLSDHTMRKKPRVSEAEIHATIISDAKIRRGCRDFEPEFTLHGTEVDASRYPNANWDVHEMHNADAWLPDCAEAFQEAVARARRKYDIEWRSWVSEVFGLLSCAPSRGESDDH